MADTLAPLDGVCVVGGCGYLGNATVRGLLQIQSTNVSVLDARPPRQPLAGVAYHQCDITQAAPTTAALQKIRPATIILSAAPAFTARQDPFLFHQVLAVGGQNVLAAAQAAGVAALVYVASVGMVNGVRETVWGTEDLPLDIDSPTLDPYYRGKIVAETAILAANTRAGVGLRTCSLRPCTLFGPDEPLTTRQLLSLGRAGRHKFQIGEGKNMGSYIYIDNMADALLLAAQALQREARAATAVPADKRVSGEAFNITNDEPWPFWRFARGVTAAGGYPMAEEDVIKLPFWFALVVAYIIEWVVWIVSLGKTEPDVSVKGTRYSNYHQTFSCEKAKARLGYKPRVSVEEGLRRISAWCREANSEKKA